MRRLVLRIIVMMMAFSIGVGIDRLTSKPLVQTPQVQKSKPVELSRLLETVETVTPPPPAPVAVEPPNTILDYNPDRFYPDGSYVIIGSLPGEFRSFKFFTLELTEPVAGQSGYIGIGSDKGDEIDFQQAVFGLVTKKRVFWVSPPLGDGFEYRFDGEFVNVNFEAVGNTNKPVLKGTLTKTKSGRKVAARIVSFRLEYDAC